MGWEALNVTLDLRTPSGAAPYNAPHRGFSYAGGNVWKVNQPVLCGVTAYVLLVLNAGADAGAGAGADAAFLPRPIYDVTLFQLKGSCCVARCRAAPVHLDGGVDGQHHPPAPIAGSRRVFRCRASPEQIRRSPWLPSSALRPSTLSNGLRGTAP